MVLIAPFIGAAVFLSGFARALPTSDYSSSGSSSNYGSSGSSNYGSGDSSSNYGSSDSSSYGSSDSSSNYGSGDSSSYGSGDSSSNYGSSNYGGSSNNYDSSSNNNYYGTTTSSAENNYATSSSTYNNNYDTSSTNNNYETSSTNNNYETSTTTAYNSYQTSSYGSGSSYWGGSGYEDCVNQCIAQFGGMSSGGGGYYQATATSGSGGSYGSGSGSTHTVIVAPTQGVFRMVPFATNASVGDVIEFHWGANEHTVTKSSALTPCNKSTEAPVFASGEHNKSFVFSQVVNDTTPTFYYCGTPTHCEKGMFGVINPSMATPGAPTSLGGMMSSMAANDSDLSAYAAYSSNVTSSNNAAATWGSNFDMSTLPEWSHSLFATNVLYTRAIMGMNADVVKPDGSIDLSSVASTPLMLPTDISTALNAASASPASAAPAGDAATAAASPSSTASAAPSKNGASSVASPRMLVGAVVVLATIFAL